MKKRIYLEERSGKAGKVIEFITEVVVIAALALFVAQFLFYSLRTESKSMEPTVLPASIVFTDRIRYAVHEPKRFDVIAFSRVAEDETSDVLIRRIVGLPGETIKISRGVVYVNGMPIDVSNMIAEITSDGIAHEEIRLNENEYFVLGDTPANSEDSRSSTIGVVRKAQIIGKTWLGAQSITQIYIIK